MGFAKDMAQVIRDGSEGAFVDLFGNTGKLPNFAKWAAGRGNYRTYFQSMNGKLLVFPGMGAGDVNRCACFYRKHVFDKNSLTPPRDFDEFYTAAKKVKELYPASYPDTCSGNLAPDRPGCAVSSTAVRLVLHCGSRCSRLD